MKNRFGTEFLPRHYKMRIVDELPSRTQHLDELFIEYLQGMQELVRWAIMDALEVEQVARVLRQCQ